MVTTHLEDILDEDLATNPIRLEVQQVLDFYRSSSLTTTQNQPKANTVPSSKSLVEFLELVDQAITNYQERTGTTTQNRVKFTEEEVDEKSETEAIVFSLVERKPGQFSQGKPLSQQHQNLRPMFREEFEDVENPTYSCLVTGYYYDNHIRFTCWAKTNKAANARARWFEDLMEEYSWWFKLQGVDRVLFLGEGTDIVKNINDNKWYGRPLEFFVRTEKIRIYREKQLEEMLIQVKVTNDLNE